MFKFFLPIRPGTLDREKRLVSRSHDRHMNAIVRLNEEIAVLVRQRDDHVAAAEAYNYAFVVIAAQTEAMKLEQPA